MNWVNVTLEELELMGQSHQLFIQANFNFYLAIAHINHPHSN